MKNKLCCLILLLSAITSQLFADGEVYDGRNFSTQSFFRRSLKNSSWISSKVIRTNFSYAKLNNSNFTGADLTGANCRFADMSGCIFTGATLYNTDFQDANLSDADLSGLDLKNKSFARTDLTNANLQGVDLSGAYLSSAKGANFTNSIIKGATLCSPTEEQLYSTRSYKDRDLEGVYFSISNGNFDLSNQNLRFAKFSNPSSYSGSVNLAGADVRGSNFDSLDSLKGAIYKNTITSSGIKNFSMTSTDDVLLIRKYQDSTKLTTDATISGGAVLTLEEGAVLEVSAGKTLTVSDNGEIVFDVDAATDDTNIILNSGSKLVFGDNSKFTINLTGEVSETDPLLFTVIKAADDSYVLGLDTLPKDNIILNVNGTAYDTSKWGINFNPTTGTLDINVNVPEPASIATIFAALALGLAAYRRRK